MNNIKIGVFQLEPGWEIILQQEGIPFEQISLEKPISVEQYSTIILTEKLTKIQTQVVNEYLQSGGSALFLAKNLKHKVCPKRYLISNKNSLFASVGLVDVNGKIFISKRGELLDENLQICSEKIGKGLRVILPFDVNRLILNIDSKRKKFYADRQELPSEIVANISKNKIRQIVRISLEFLHHCRDLPFVQKWYYPNGEKNIFIFRVDTDFCSAENTKKLHQICQENEIRGSWFVDTTSDDKLANVYAKMKNQEIGLHCFRHLVFKDYQQNFDDFKKGISQLKKAEIKSTGYVAPFGDWNENLGKVIADFGFQYSSEFTLNYDDFPFFPFVDGTFSKTLQIPIYPISMGRLHRSHFSETEKLTHYKQVILEKMITNEPIILYHHPEQLRFELWHEIFTFINENKIHKMTMNEFANWWQKRDDFEINCHFENNKIFFDKTECYVRISTKNGEKIISQKSINLDEINWQKKNIKSKDFSEMRKFSWREILYNYESKRARKYL